MLVGRRRNNVRLPGLESRGDTLMQWNLPPTLVTIQSNRYLMSPKRMEVVRGAVMVLVKVVHRPRARDRTWSELQVLVLLSPGHNKHSCPNNYISYIIHSLHPFLLVDCTHLDIRARRSSELNLLKVEPMMAEEEPAPVEDNSGGCEVMCSS